MSINATIDGTTYEGITDIIMGDKNVLLEQIKDANTDDPWDGSLDNIYSFGYIIDCIEKATQTGTFVGGSTIEFDTELGADAKYLVIVDETAPTFPSQHTNYTEGIYLFVYNVETDQVIRVLLMGSSATESLFFGGGLSYGTSTAFNRASSVSFIDGVFKYVPLYDNNSLYNNFTPERTYRWYAW